MERYLVLHPEQSSPRVPVLSPSLFRARTQLEDGEVNDELSNSFTKCAQRELRQTYEVRQIWKV